MEAILSPSYAISDQYATTVITRTDGSKMVGRIVGENDQELTLSLNPYMPDQTVTVPLSDVASQEPSPVSLMPPGLLNRLNEDEVLDLMAFLLSGGDPDHEYFTGRRAPEASE